jgi:hypothetical protein
VWIAELVPEAGNLRLSSLRRLQELPGEDHPFERLVGLLRQGEFFGAAIDAPFSIPAQYVPEKGHGALLRLVGGMRRDGRPFPEAHAFVNAVTDNNPPRNHILRATERYWRERRVNVRSTVWAGPRGGAAMTAACLTLLAKADGPIWPWATEAKGLLVEAFPAAQLRQWELPHEQYNGRGQDHMKTRAKMVQAIGKRIRCYGAHASEMRASADALDAVLCALAAVAVTAGTAAARPKDAESWKKEGWIAVHC